MYQINPRSPSRNENIQLRTTISATNTSTPSLVIGRYRSMSESSSSRRPRLLISFFFFQAEDGIRDLYVTGVQTCALPIGRMGESRARRRRKPALPVGQRGRCHARQLFVGPGREIKTGHASGGDVSTECVR